MKVAKAEMTTKPVDRSEKLKALDLALTQISKSHGKGSIMKMSDKPHVVDIGVIPSGSLALDVALGIGGFPRGRIIEIYGAESSGKTTLALHVVAEAQKLGGICAYIDAENAMDPQYTKNLGVNLDELLISQPDSGEQALDITETLVRSNAIDVVVIDSVAALVPKAELEGDMGDSHMGLQARLMSQALRKLTTAISRSNTCVIFINQVREKIGSFYGPSETTTGGRALKFYASIRVQVRRTGSMTTSDGKVTGNHVKAKMVKNKMAPPFTEADFDILFGEGISKHLEVLDLAVLYKIVGKSGAWFNYGDVKLGQGRENVRVFFKENEAVFEEIYAKLKGVIQPSDLRAAASAEENEEL